MPYEVVSGNVRTFCSECQKEMISTVTVGYFDYTSDDIFISGGAPPFGEPAITNSFITDKVCAECRKLMEEEEDLD